MRIRLVAGALWLGLALAVAARAQGSATIEIVADGGAYKVKPDAGREGGKLLLAGRDGTVRVKLPAGVACEKLAVKLLDSEGEDLGAADVGSADDAGCLVKIRGVPATGYVLAISVAGKRVASDPSLVVMPGKAAVAGDSTGGLTLADALSCTAEPAGCGECYDARENLARFEVTALGTVLAGPRTSIDEDDAIEVVVHAHPQLIPFLWVRRTSAIRNTSDLRIVGKGIRLPALGETKQAAGGPCGSETIFLRDFEPGPATVTISARVGEKTIDLGSFEFVVNRLYHGVLGFGPVASFAKPTHYEVVDRAGAAVIEETRSKNDGRLDYAFTYTAFLSRRDLEKPPEWRSWQRLNPTVGFLTQDPHLNALVGVSYDVSTLALTLGVHLTKGDRLTRQSGLYVGAPFSGAANTIPTRAVLESGLFASAQMDLRAAFALLGAMGGK